MEWVVNVGCRNTDAMRTEHIKANVQSTHGKISFACYDFKKSPLISKRFKMGPNELAIVHRGICLATYVVLW